MITYPWPAVAHYTDKLPDYVINLVVLVKEAIDIILKSISRWSLFVL